MSVLPAVMITLVRSIGSAKVKVSVWPTPSPSAPSAQKLLTTGRWRIWPRGRARRSSPWAQGVHEVDFGVEEVLDAADAALGPSHDLASQRREREPGPEHADHHQDHRHFADVGQRHLGLEAGVMGLLPALVLRIVASLETRRPSSRPGRTSSTTAASWRPPPGPGSCRTCGRTCGPGRCPTRTGCTRGRLR